MSVGFPGGQELVLDLGIGISFHGLCINFKTRIGFAEKDWFKESRSLDIGVIPW